jgi:hypothetical protein
MYKWMDTAILSSMWRDISSIIYRLSSVRLQFDRSAGGKADRKTNRAGEGKGEGEARARAREIEREHKRRHLQRSRRAWRL